MIGIGIPSSQNSTPLPKPMEPSFFRRNENAFAADKVPLKELPCRGSEGGQPVRPAILPPFMPRTGEAVVVVGAVCTPGGRRDAHGGGRRDMDGGRSVTVHRGKDGGRRFVDGGVSGTAVGTPTVWPVLATSRGAEGTCIGATMRPAGFYIRTERTLAPVRQVTGGRRSSRSRWPQRVCAWRRWSCVLPGRAGQHSPVAMPAMRRTGRCTRVGGSEPSRERRSDVEATSPGARLMISHLRCRLSCSSTSLVSDDSSNLCRCRQAFPRRLRRQQTNYHRSCAMCR
jgi:hypothetical protein